LKDVHSNSELLRQLKNGDMLAFDTIYAKYSKRLYGFVLRYIKFEPDAEGIVQEVFIKIWKARSKIDVYSSFEAFLFTIAYNTTMSLLRKRLNEKKYLEQLESLQIPYPTNEIMNEIQFNELNERVQFLLTKLTPRQKEVFQLSREDGLTHEEIAKKLNISISTVKNHMVSALCFFKSNLNNALTVNAFFACLFL
jgi:RNA polymerase sigma-70 factor (ECF subfamily)